MKNIFKKNHLRNGLILFQGGGGRSEIRKSYKKCLNLN